MIINKNTWHYKWFMKWVINKYTENGRFPIGNEIDESYLIRYAYGTLTLCTYVKVILIYAPIRYSWINKIIRLSMLNMVILLVIYAEIISSRFNAIMFFFSIVVITFLVLASFMLPAIFYGDQIKSKLGNTSEKVKISHSYLC